MTKTLAIEGRRCRGAALFDLGLDRSHHAWKRQNALQRKHGFGQSQQQESLGPL